MRDRTRMYARESVCHMVYVVVVADLNAFTEWVGDLRRSMPLGPGITTHMMPFYSRIVLYLITAHIWQRKALTDN